MAGGGELETSLVPCTTFQVRRFRLFPSRALQAAQVLVTPPSSPSQVSSLQRTLCLPTVSRAIPPPFNRWEKRGLER